ncbi:MAG: glycerol-3-phosphate dehydrogenase [Alphaproteobacteria bacterium]|nr:glycerol-3-phosphate dehydrogenase [Alphaproteobacteria bacterium]
MDQEFDVCVVGGGINGAGIARDAAGRGLSVLLVEQGDLAGATSSASSKLIHGGLRYLEYYEFGLVRKALREREVLLGLAPHIIWPLTFILPHDRLLRPAWMIRAGLFLYDHLAARVTLSGSSGVDLASHPTGKILKEGYKLAFRYSDCWVDDSRLAVLNAMDAKERGAAVMTRTRCRSLLPIPRRGIWQVGLEDCAGRQKTASARTIVNAAGPWVQAILEENGLVTKETPSLRLVKGSHIVVPKVHDGEEAFILQQPDGRVVFVLPFESNFSLIGTTEEPISGDPGAAAISEAEMSYLCDAVNRSFRVALSPESIIWHFSGVRPLLDGGEEDISSVTRDYHLMKSSHYECGILSVFGGKVTTYRALAEEAVGMLTDKPGWTAESVLPGGDLGESFEAFLDRKKARYPWLPEDLLRRYARAYGTRMDIVLEGKASLESLGREVCEGLYEAEIAYLGRYEFARTAGDVLWRRTKLGLHMAADEDPGAEIEVILDKYSPDFS